MQDDSYAGKLKDGEGCLAVHWNMTYWINKIVPEGAWWHFIAPDERYAPQDYANIAYQVKCAILCDYESVTGPDHLFIRDERTGKYDRCVNFKTQAGFPHHFLKKPAKWEKGLGIHTGYTIPVPEKQYRLLLPHYHFALVKKTRQYGKGPRDHEEYKDLPRYPNVNPMGEDWRTLDTFVDDNGKLLNDLDVEVIIPLAEEQHIKTSNIITLNQAKLAQLKMESARLKRVASWRDEDIVELEAKIKEMKTKL